MNEEGGTLLPQCLLKIYREETAMGIRDHYSLPDSLMEQIQAALILSKSFRPLPVENMTCYIFKPFDSIIYWWYICALDPPHIPASLSSFFPIFKYTAWPAIASKGDIWAISRRDANSGIIQRGLFGNLQLASVQLTPILPVSLRHAWRPWVHLWAGVSSCLQHTWTQNPEWVTEANEKNSEC